MKLRLLLTGLLAFAVAAPVIATAPRFNDVPADHRYAEAIRWAGERELFLGYPDGRFGPDDELTETQFDKVVRRLYNSADRWTRAETAAILHSGITGLNRVSDPPLAPATSYAAGTQTCAVPLGTPYWVSKPDTFRFPAMDNCRQNFKIVVLYPPSRTQYVPEADGSWTNLHWPDRDVVDVQVEQNNKRLRTIRVISRNILDTAPTTTTTKPADTTTTSSSTTTTTTGAPTGCLWPLGTPVQAAGADIKFPIVRPAGEFHAPLHIQHGNNPR